jgi:hypothetical protein
MGMALVMVALFIRQTAARVTATILSRTGVRIDATVGV